MFPLLEVVQACRSLLLPTASEHKVISFEEPELTADDDLIEREDETDVQHNIPKRSRRMAATAGDFLFY